MTKVVWSPRSLLNGPHVALVMSQDEFQAALAERGIEDDEMFCPDGCRAVTHSFRKHGDLTCIIGLHPDARTASPIEVASVLVHEAVHVWQRTVDATAFGNARECWGTEGEAHAIENISRELMQAFADRLEVE